MTSSNLTLRRTVAAAILSTIALAGTVTVDDAKLPTSNKWRIQVNGGANSDGTITLRLTPIDGTASDFVTTIKKDRGENGIAGDIRDAVRATFDKKAYDAETDDGEEVIVNKRGKSKNFTLQLLESNVDGVRLTFNKDKRLDQRGDAGASGTYALPAR